MNQNDLLAVVEQKRDEIELRISSGAWTLSDLPRVLALYMASTEWYSRELLDTSEKLLSTKREHLASTREYLEELETVGRVISFIEAADSGIDSPRGAELMAQLREAQDPIAHALLFAAKKLESNARKSVAAKAASAKLAKDSNGKQAAKAEARKLWVDWQTGKTIHRSAAAFARFVVKTLPIIESEEAVKRWERDWRKDAAPK